MSGITDATSSTIPLTDSNGPVPPADYLPNVQPNYRLTEKNYLKWSQFVQTFLKGKGKLSHLLGIKPPKEDPKYAAWDEADSMVMSWLWNSMAPEISDTCMFLKTAQDIWDTCKQTYSRVHDAAQIYDIKTRISNTKQGTHSVTEYANILQNPWQELDYYQCIKMESSKDAATLRRFLEKERIYVFLAGLIIEFDAVRVQVLGKEDLPSLNEAIGIIRGEESRRGVMLESKTVERSAMIMKEAKRGGSNNNNNSYAGGWSETAKFGSRDPVVCTYCKKPYHTRDRCWKLHGKPSNLQNLQETNKTGTARSNQGQAHISSSQPKGEIEVTSDNVEFNREQIAKLKQMLENLDKPSGLGNCSLASSGIVPTSFTLSVSNINRTTTWLVDSGATDHMTQSAHEFVTYSPCSSNKKIATADGTLVTVAGQGDVVLHSNICLKDVLHVPKLSTSLISTHKLTCDLNCIVTFFPTHCIFHDQGTGKMIGLAKEQNGLYHLDESNGQNSTLKHSVSLLSESILSNKNKIWLHHLRLGHPSFSVLRILFPSLFKGIDIGLLHCDVCELAKHKRVPFPISNKKMSFPFHLIHSDVWGPSTVSNISGARWFVLFIDDCTRMSWVFLLKNKSDVTSTFKNFFFMIKTQFDVEIKRVRSDNAKDYFNHDLSSFFIEKGIIHESSCVYTPQQNGVAERKIGHLLATTRAFLFQNQVPKSYWGEAVLTAAHLINRLPSKVLDHKSPVDVFSKFFPVFRLTNQLAPRIFGCVAFVHVHSYQRGKLDPRALKCVFLGFSYTQKGYKCYHPSTKRFFVSADVSFVEHESYFTATYLQGETSLTEDKQRDLFLLDLSTHTPVIPDPVTLDPQTANPNLSTVPAEQAESSSPIVTTPQLAPNILPPSEPTQSQGATRPLQVYTRRKAPLLQPMQHQESDTDLGTDKGAEKIEVNSNPKTDESGVSDSICSTKDNLPIAIRKGVRECTKRSLYPLSQYVSFERFSSSHKSFLTHLNTITIPKTTSEALGQKEWRDAMRVEMDALEKNKTWELVELPRGKKPVGCRWVFTVKYKADGSLERYKARLVAKGYTQTYEIDYLETFAPVAK